MSTIRECSSRELQAHVPLRFVGFVGLLEEDRATYWSLWLDQYEPGYRLDVLNALFDDVLTELSMGQLDVGALARRARANKLKFEVIFEYEKMWVILSYYIERDRDVIWIGELRFYAEFENQSRPMVPIRKYTADELQAYGPVRFVGLLDEKDRAIFRCLQLSQHERGYRLDVLNALFDDILTGLSTGQLDVGALVRRARANKLKFEVVLQYGGIWVTLLHYIDRDLDEDVLIGELYFYAVFENQSKPIKDERHMKIHS